MQKRNDLWAYLQQVPVVDTHEHFHLFTDTQGYDLVNFLYSNSYMSTLAMHIEPERIARITDTACSEEERYQTLLSVYDRVRYTRCGRTVRDMVRLWGVDDLRPDNLPRLQAAFDNRLHNLKMPKQICAYIVNSAGHPLYGYVRGLGDYIAGKMPCDEKVYVNPLISGLHCLYTRQDIEDVAYAADMEIDSVTALIDGIQRIMEGCVKAGAVGFKDVYTYFRAYEIGKPDRSAAEKDFDNIRSGNTATGALADFMFYQVYDVAQQLHKPMGIHTGFIITSCAPAGCLGTLGPVMEAFPALQFDLYHFNYPLLEPYVQMMKSYPNVYANGAWATGMMTEYAKLFLKEALHSLPAERVLAYGGDSHCAGEMTQVTLNNALQVVDSVLGDAMAEGYLSLDEAENVAKIWLSGSARRLYRI